MKRLFGVVLAATVLSGCGTSRLLSYGGQLSDAKVELGAAAFSVYVHPKDDTLLIQRRFGQTTNLDGPELIGIVASQFLQPIECSVGNVERIAPGSWEASFSCPSSVDIRRLVAAQRGDLQSGAPIKP